MNLTKEIVLDGRNIFFDIVCTNIFVACSDPISCIIFNLFIFILIDKKLITSYQKVHIYSFYSYLYIANKNDNITKSNDNNYI